MAARIGPCGPYEGRARGPPLPKRETRRAPTVENNQREWPQFRRALNFTISAPEPQGLSHVFRPRRKDQQRCSGPRHDEGLGAGQPRRAQADGKAGAGAQARRSAGAHRCGGDLRHRSRNHRSRPAGLDPGRHAIQQEFHARPRIHGHGRGARARRRRVQDRPARHGRNPRRLRPVQALPRRHVHLVPQLRAQLRRRRQGPPRQRLHHRWRLLRVSGQQRQHADRHSGRDVGRGGDAGGDRRHRDVRPHRAGRPRRRRERCRYRAGADRPPRRRGGEGDGRATR